MRRVAISIACAACALVVSAQPATAAEIPHYGVYVGVSGGGHFALDRWTLGADDLVGSSGAPKYGGLVSVRVGGQAQYWLGIETELSVLPLKATDSIALAMHYGLSLVLQPSRGAFEPFFVIGAGLYQSFKEPLGADTDFAIHAGLGMRAMVHDRVALRFEARTLWTDGADLGINLTALVGLDVYAWYRDADSDKDGIPDSSDQCPEVPGPKETQGCPDKDKDGLSDHEDDCPDAFGPANTKGCPDKDKDGLADKVDECVEDAGPKELKGCPDTDGDGMRDKEDACPKDAGPRVFAGCPDTDGDGLPDPRDLCPKAKGAHDQDGCPDTDKDGLHDKKDMCPEQPGKLEFGGCPDTDGDGLPDPKDLCPDVKGKAEDKGCPPDSDRDGIYDADDKCPKQPGLRELKGCPPAELKKFTGAIAGINFESGSAKILKTSFKLLDEAAAVLGKFPSVKVTIEGHTDDQGPDAANLKLSQARAESVLNYLVEHGLTKDRLTAIGFGETKPVAPNKTKAGQAKNRRIEFVITNQGATP